MRVFLLFLLALTASTLASAKGPLKLNRCMEPEKKSGEYRTP